MSYMGLILAAVIIGVWHALDIHLAFDMSLLTGEYVEVDICISS